MRVLVLGKRRRLPYRTEFLVFSGEATTASGELVFHIFSALAQFERCLIQERTRAGLAAARARGRRGGRRALQPGDPKVELAYTMYIDHRWSIEELCATLSISRATCYR